MSRGAACCVLAQEQGAYYRIWKGQSVDESEGRRLQVFKSRLLISSHTGTTTFFAQFRSKLTVTYDGAIQDVVRDFRL